MKNTGTEEQIRSLITRLAVIMAIAGTSLFASNADAYQLGGRWTNTAHGPTGALGSPVTLTWGFVDDGTGFSQAAGGGTSNFIDFLDGIIVQGPAVTT